MSTEFKYVMVGVLIGSVIVLTAVCIHQSITIAMQKEVIVEMYRFIHAGCPNSMIH